VHFVLSNGVTWIFYILVWEFDRWTYYESHEHKLFLDLLETSDQALFEIMQLVLEWFSPLEEMWMWAVSAKRGGGRASEGERTRTRKGSKGETEPETVTSNCWLCSTSPRIYMIYCKQVSGREGKSCTGC